MSSSNVAKSREELIANIPRTCLACDSCGKANPAHECRKCYTAHYCSSDCLRKLASHECHDLETMRNALIGIGTSLDMAQAKNDTCGICLGMPMTDPAVLPGCQHAFCRRCLQEWHGMEKFQKEIKCPTCRGVMLFDKSDDNPIEKAKIYGAAAKKSKDDRARLCKKALDELETFLANKDGSNLSALFIKAEILLIQSEPQMALQVLDDILEIDRKHRMERKAVSDYLDQSEAARQSGNIDEAERIMGSALELAGKRGEKLGTILQTLVDVFLMQAEAHQQLDEWFIAKEIYKDLLGLGSGTPPWVLGAAFSAMILLLTYVCFGSGPAETFARQLSMATMVATTLYGVFGRFLMAPKSKSKLLAFPPELRAPLVPQQRQCYMNMIKCYYCLREYDRAIRAGAFATHMNRHFPGVHEYIAKSHKAKGKHQEAQRTMQQAVLFETPWDVENIAKQLQILEEIAHAK